MIIFDRPFTGSPRVGRCKGRSTLCAHLVSTLPGAGGTEELLHFARRIGMHPGWIQHRGTHREHFDLIGPGPIDRARGAGALEVPSRVLGLVLLAKRSGTEHIIPLAPPPESPSP